MYLCLYVCLSVSRMCIMCVLARQLLDMKRFDVRMYLSGRGLVPTLHEASYADSRDVGGAWLPLLLSLRASCPHSSTSRHCRGCFHLNASVLQERDRADTLDIGGQCVQFLLNCTLLLMPVETRLWLILQMFVLSGDSQPTGLLVLLASLLFPWVFVFLGLSQIGRAHV